MTFPKVSGKLEKPPFLRGLRWKIMIAFVLLFFGLISVLGTVGSMVEYGYLRKSFTESAVNNNQSLVNWTFAEDWDSVRIDNLLVADYNILQKDSAELLPWLDPQKRNADAIKLWLKRYDEKLKLRRKTAFSSIYLFPDDLDLDETAETSLKIDDYGARIMKKPIFRFIVFNEKNEIIASADSDKSEVESYADEKLFTEEMFEENAGYKRKLDDKKPLHLQMAFPILNNEKQIKGVLYLSETLPVGWNDVFLNNINFLTDNFAANIIFFTIMGFVFGSPFASYLSRRLQKIASAAQSWRTGDFSVKTNDKSSDEVGILSRHLNEMADDLRENFALRQTIATAEERNRIARDLHDSVKQQVFGLAMQISTASALVEKNPESAKNYLHESENLIKEIQAELVDMIHEFSLPANESQTFKLKIENFVGDWSRQNVMKTEIDIDEKLRIPTEIGQTFYRITQETLSNIARHSEATKVKISLKNSNKKLSMSFIDNGCGFDAAKIKKGFGLQSIRERAESLPNGWLKINSKINGGTTIEVGCEAKESI
jgi:signal transduction histidine kinase